MTADRRRLLLYGILAAVVAWSGWLALDDDATPARDDAADMLPAARPSQPSTAAPARATPAPAVAANEPRLTLPRTNLFPEQTWYVPPPPPPPPPPAPYAPPPPPEAPPLPYSYVGRWQEGGETTFYLARGALPVSVRAGQVLDGVWKLDTVDRSALNFVYLPLNQTRSLRTGD